MAKTQMGLSHLRLVRETGLESENSRFRSF